MCTVTAFTVIAGAARMLASQIDHRRPVIGFGPRHATVTSPARGTTDVVVGACGTFRQFNMIAMQFTEALRATSPQQELLVACRRLREWVDLPDAERARQVNRAINTESLARTLVQAKPLVWGRLAREFAAPASDVIGALGALDARTASGVSTAADLEYVRRVMALIAINACVMETFPLAAAGVAPDPQLTDIVAMVPALEEAIYGCDVNVATAASLVTLHSAIELFMRSADAWTPPIHVNHAWWLGMAQYTVGRAALEIGDARLALQAFEQGVADFERARDWKNADDLRARIIAIDRGTLGDVDAMVTSSLRSLLTPQNVMRRCGSLAALATASKEAGDQFEYSRLAEHLAQTLIAAGFVDPQWDADAAMQYWLQTVVDTLERDDLLACASTVGVYWVVVMGARATERGEDGALRDAPRAARAEQCLQAIGAAVGALLEDAASVNAEVVAELAEWFDPATMLEPVPADIEREPSSASSASARNALAGAAISGALYANRLACNERPSETQLIDVTRLVVKARALRSRIHEVQALLAQAYILLALKRYADVSAIVQEALHTLSPTRIATLDACTLSHERELYLSVKQFEVRALVALRMHSKVLTACQSVISEIERQRTRVNAPYQQSAFLITRAEFYECCAAAAHKLGLHDLVLTTTEQLKASSTWKLGRIVLDSLPPEVAAEISSLDAQYGAVNRALAVNAAPGVVLAELLERRRRIATARAIARGKAHTDAPPVVTVDAVQRALGDEEAALSWFWLSDELLLVLVFTRELSHTFTIELSAQQRSLFERWIVIMSTMAAETSSAIASELDDLVDMLAPTFLPTNIRQFVQGKSRLILSPHRALHLLPFHAMRIADNVDKPWLIQHAAVRYAPNLASLLLEWNGNRTGPVLAIGIDDFGDTGFPPLENAKLEAQQVAAAFGAAGHVDTAVTRASFASMPLKGYRCLHLATHGSSVLRGDAHNDPLTCGIALSDGLFDGWQLAALDIRAELVVLASCYSGQRAIGGRGLAQLPGDDILGLQAALFEAGAGTILGALWPVDDEISRAILVDFHRHYAAGSDPDRALQSALISYLANPFRRHGRYDWAPFFLTSACNLRAPRR